MKATITFEDIFEITGRGTAITGRVKDGEIYEGDVILIGDYIISIIQIERFAKAFKCATPGDNVGLLIGFKYSKKELTEFRGELLNIEDASYLREKKLNELLK